MDVIPPKNEPLVANCGKKAKSILSNMNSEIR
jgi:hypothetical protein